MSSFPSKAIRLIDTIGIPSKVPHLDVSLSHLLTSSSPLTSHLSNHQYQL